MGIAPRMGRSQLWRAPNPQPCFDAPAMQTCRLPASESTLMSTVTTGTSATSRLSNTTSGDGHADSAAQRRVCSRAAPSPPVKSRPESDSTHGAPVSAVAATAAAPERTAAPVDAHASADAHASSTPIALYDSAACTAAASHACAASVAPPPTAAATTPQAAANGGADAGASELNSPVSAAAAECAAFLTSCIARCCMRRTAAARIGSSRASCASAARKSGTARRRSVSTCGLLATPTATFSQWTHRGCMLSAMLGGRPSAPRTSSMLGEHSSARMPASVRNATSPAASTPATAADSGRFARTQPPPPTARVAAAAADRC
eukprot:357069-Chlamydomonas_euryale.AAC.9